MHTKEPWVVDGTEIICAHDSSHIAEVPDGGSPEQDAADRARIVSCVNAMAGIPDPAAYVTAFEAMVEALVDAVEIIDDQLGGDFPDSLMAFRTALQAARLARGDA